MASTDPFKLLACLAPPGLLLPFQYLMTITEVEDIRSSSIIDLGYLYPLNRCEPVCYHLLKGFAHGGISVIPELRGEPYTQWTRLRLSPLPSLLAVKKAALS